MLPCGICFSYHDLGTVTVLVSVPTLVDEVISCMLALAPYCARRRLIADVSNLRAANSPPSTTPSEILGTTAMPDIVVIKQCEITLAVPFNSHKGLVNAKHCKEGKENYQLVLSDLESRVYSANFTTIEIGHLDIGFHTHGLIVSSNSPRSLSQPSPAY